MAKFVYRMQNILDIKYQLESQAKIAFANANALLRAEEEKLETLKQRKIDYEQKSEELVRGGRIDILEINVCKKAIVAIEAAIEAQLLEVHIAEKRVDVARRKLNDVMVERKTHEKLKEKAFEEFKQELAQEENRAVDELVSYNYREEMNDMGGE